MHARMRRARARTPQIDASSNEAACVPVLCKSGVIGIDRHHERQVLTGSQQAFD
jgi:hypothetical protein